MEVVCHLCRIFDSMSCDEDLEEQKNELLALKEIVGEENVVILLKKCLQDFKDLNVEIREDFFKQFQQRSDVLIGGVLTIEPLLNEAITITWNDYSR